MKKLIAAILTLSLLLGAWSLSSLAAEEESFRFTAAAEVSADGSTVTLTVAFENSPGFNSVRLRVGYNSDVFTLTKAVNVSEMEAFMKSPSYSAKPYVLTFYNTSLVEGDMDLAVMTFSVRENVGAFAEDFTLTVDDGDCMADELVLSPAVSGATCAAVVGYTPCGEEEFTFTSDGKGATLTGYIGSASSCVVPSTLGGLPVVAVETGAFAGNSTLTSVTLPSTVVTVSEGAFDGCAALEYTVPNPNCVIADGAFRGTAAEAKFRGFANLEAAVDGEFVALNGIVSADMYQYSLDGDAFRVINSLATVGGLSRVGIRVTRDKTSSTLTGETDRVMLSVTNYIGEVVDGSSPYVDFNYLYVGLISAVGLENGETFTITPYALAMDGTVYYGENVKMTYQEA